MTEGCQNGSHTRRCYWDFTECRWVCRPEVLAPVTVPVRDETPPPAQRSA